METLRNIWSQSKVFRILLVVALIYGFIRFAAEVWLATERMLPGQSETQIAPDDLQLYIDSATRLESHQSLYPSNPQHIEVFQYPPFFALAFIPFLWLLRISPDAFMVAQFILRIAAYILLVFWWAHIFSRTKQTKVVELWAWTIPIWIIFSAFWSDLVYLNIDFIVALFTTLFIDAVLDEKMGLSVLWFTILLLVKPHWAFVAVVPLLLGNWRYFLKLLGWSAAATITAYIAFLLIAGPSYGWQQMENYIPFVMSLSKSIPWRGPEAGYLGYNHSITQIVVFYLGVSRTSLLLANIVKVLLLSPLVIYCIKMLFRPVNRKGYDVPLLAINLTFTLFLGVFIWMDRVWNVVLGCAIFSYLLATLNGKRFSRILVWVVFIPYVLVDFWQIASYAIFGDRVLAQGDYVLTDYSIYVPIYMLVILVFYVLLIKQLWRPLINSPSTSLPMEDRQ